MSNQAEANLSALIESTDDLIWAVDLDYRLVAFNTALRQHMEFAFGIRPALGMQPKDLVPPERRGLMPPLYGRALAEGSFQTEFLLADGHALEMTFNPILVNGRATGISVFGKDITERKQATRALAASDARNRRFFVENASVMLLVEPAGGTILAANQAASRFYGYDVEQLAGMPIARINTLPPERVAQEHERALREEGSFFQFQHRLADGQICDVEVYSSPIHVEGAPLLLSVVHDVTSRVKAEQTLIESAESLREAQRIAGLGSYVLDIPGGVWTSSETLDEILGIDKEYKCTVSGWTALIYPSDQAMMAAYFAEEVVGKRQPFNKEYRIIRQTDLEERWVHGHGRLDFDTHGLPVRMRGTIQDITARKRVEMQLRDSEVRYRATFDQAAIGIVHSGRDGKLLRCNARFAAMLGYLPGEMRGLTVEQVTFPEEAPLSAQAIREIWSGEPATICLEKRYRRKDGSTTWARVTVSMQRDAEGRALHSIALVEDINVQKAAEERLAATREALRESEARYRTAFQMVQDSIDICRLDDGKFLDVNDEFVRITGFAREEVIGRTAQEIGIWANPADRERLFEEMRLNSACRNLEVQYRVKDGTLRWSLLSVSKIELEGVPCILSVTRDITDAKAAEERLAATREALRESEARYRTAFQTSHNGVSIHRYNDGMCLDVNQTYREIMGYEREEVVGKTTLELDLWVDRSDRERMAESLRREGNFRDEVQFRKKNGEIFWAMMSSSLFEHCGVACVLSVTEDITNAKAAQDEIRNLAFYDPLTTLPNRRLFQDRLRQTLSAGPRHRRKKALLFVDLDNFKNLNDTLGHQTGDLLLQEVASRLRFCLRETDTVARVGGDEFLIMLEELSQTPEDAAAQAEAVAEKILASLERPYWLDGRECRSSASIGITIFGDRRETPDDVMQQADIAMYQAKAAGRNTIRFFAPALQTAVVARAALEEELRRGINASEFVLFYQPLVDCNRLIGAEALLRWNHPRRGLLPPGEFIPLAEETGLIVPLGNWVLETACARIAAWEMRGQATSISVNISARQFRQQGFAQMVVSALDRTGASPHRLTLELTESLLLDDVEETIARMQALKLCGVRFSLDDFGTGYSSLSYLKRLPLDQLKIDRSFVRDILVDISSGAIAQAVISLCRSMRLSVIAEGVETEEQRDCLARLGCHAYQGFLFSRPIPVEEFQRLWLRAVESAALGVT